ncbi:MAG: MotA/TolQ/ExbB proton channel family protein [Bdellovibrionaceae bacterium]|nr:MotA/TolQ/ExbB proton channel family protein [Pseudobdellovibrionaceae bacterium]MDW8191301.1 MotA/TolQ/ExbB proton channel family protein [Pseudobdellovibrionaceae bacterium]
MNSVTVDTSIWSAIWGAGFVVQLTLILLILMSVVSWAVIMAKWYQFRRTKMANVKLVEKLQKGKSLEVLNEAAEELASQSSMARVFVGGYSFFRKLQEDIRGNKVELPFAIELLEREFARQIRNQLALLEDRLIWLASTGSVAPFVGLFGTVWGILNSFHKIGAMGSASLAVVAPGISEALVATAVGLFAAIPATFFYNQFVAQVRVQEIELNDMSQEVIIMMKQELN